MPDLNPPAKPANVPAFAAEAAAQYADAAYDIALGCECADPMLQIERWSHETAAPGAPRDAH